MTATRDKKGADRSRRPSHEASGVLHDPLFDDIGDLLIVFFNRHRVAVTENAEFRKMDAGGVTAYRAQQSGIGLIRISTLEIAIQSKEGNLRGRSTNR